MSDWANMSSDEEWLEVRRGMRQSGYEESDDEGEGVAVAPKEVDKKDAAEAREEKVTTSSTDEKLMTTSNDEKTSSAAEKKENEKSVHEERMEKADDCDRSNNQHVEEMSAVLLAGLHSQSGDEQLVDEEKKDNGSSRSHDEKNCGVMYASSNPLMTAARYAFWHASKPRLVEEAAFSDDGLLLVRKADGNILNIPYIHFTVNVRMADECRRFGRKADITLKELQLLVKDYADESAYDLYWHESQQNAYYSIKDENDLAAAIDYTIVDRCRYDGPPCVKLTMAFPGRSPLHTRPFSPRAPSPPRRAIRRYSPSPVRRFHRSPTSSFSRRRSPSPLRPLHRSSISPPYSRHARYYDDYSPCPRRYFGKHSPSPDGAGFSYPCRTSPLRRCFAGAEVDPDDSYVRRSSPTPRPSHTPKVAATAPVSQDPLKSAEAYGSVVSCDGCDMLLCPDNGGRFKCVVCADYDLCEECHRKGMHKEHCMLFIAHGQSLMRRATLNQAAPVVSFKQHRMSSTMPIATVLYDAMQQLRFTDSKATTEVDSSATGKSEPNEKDAQKEGKKEHKKNSKKDRLRSTVESCRLGATEATTLELTRFYQYALCCILLKNESKKCHDVVSRVFALLLEEYKKDKPRGNSSLHHNRNESALIPVFLRITEHYTRLTNPEQSDSDVRAIIASRKKLCKLPASVHDIAKKSLPIMVRILRTVEDEITKKAAVTEGEEALISLEESLPANGTASTPASPPQPAHSPSQQETPFLAASKLLAGVAANVAESAASHLGAFPAHLRAFSSSAATAAQAPHVYPTLNAEQVAGADAPANNEEQQQQGRPSPPHHFPFVNYPEWLQKNVKLHFPPGAETTEHAQPTTPPHQSDEAAPSVPNNEETIDERFECARAFLFSPSQELLYQQLCALNVTNDDELLLALAQDHEYIETAADKLFQILESRNRVAP